MVNPIGTYVSPEFKINFFARHDDPNSISAKVSDTETYQVEVPDIPSLRALSTTEKVKRLLRNCNLVPVIHSENTTIKFERIQNTKTFENKGEHKLPANYIKYVCRSNGTISYFYVNSVYTWDWVNNKTSIQTFDTLHITALTEKFEGSLIIGDEEGYLHFSDQKIFTGISQKIVQIVTLDFTQYVIKYEKGNIQIFDLTTGLFKHFHSSDEKIYPFFIFDTPKTLFVLNDGAIIALVNDEVNIFLFDRKEKTYKKLEKTFKNVESIHQFNQITVALKNKITDEFDILDSKNQFNPIRVDWINEDSFKSIILKDNQKVIFNSDKDNIKVWKAGEARPRHIKGFIKILNMLSDGLIIYETGSGGDKEIKIISQTNPRKFIFSQNVNNYLDKIAGHVKNFHELVDGSILIEFYSDHLLILKPKFIDEVVCSDDLNKIKQSILKNPYILSLYRTIVLKQSVSEKNISYLAGFIAALKLSYSSYLNYFYQKVIKTLSSIENFSILLEYLKCSPYQKLYRVAYLKLHALKENKNFPIALKNQRCKTRLFVGEGNFTFAEALLNKHQATHQKLGAFLTATELSKPVNKEIEERISRLVNSGVKIFFGIDATRLHLYFKNKRFERIHWNCPFGGTSTDKRKLFEGVIPQFFESCSKIQLVGDRVHISLAQVEGYRIERQLENPIVYGAKSSNYRLIKKRKFGETRFPGYRHTKTGTDVPVPSVPPDCEREFIFEKKENGSDLGFLSSFKSQGDTGKLYWTGHSTLIDSDDNDLNKKEYKVNSIIYAQLPTQVDLKDCYYECSTDEDSSDYYDSDENS